MYDITGTFIVGVLVRGVVPALETIQYNTLRGVIGLMPANTVSKVGLYAELGVWRIETRHKMAALRLLREIMRSDPDSDLRAIYNEYRDRCAATGWPAGSWCNWLRQALVPGGHEELLYDWPDWGPDPREIISNIELQYWQQGIDAASSLQPHYAAVKTVSLQREDYVRHPSRKVAAAMACVRLGYGPFGVSLRVEVPRYRRTCVHCNCGAVDTTQHFLLECSVHALLRARMTAELLARVSPGLAMQLGQPGDNPDMWFKLLLQARLGDLGEEYGMPMRALALKIRFARNPRPPNHPPLSPAAQLAAEVKLELQQIALADRQAISAVAQRGVYKMYTQRTALVEDHPRRGQQPHAAHD